MILTDYSLNPSRLPSPYPPTLGLLPFLIPCPYHYPVCRPAHGHTGVFQNNFLWHKLLALIFAINPFLLFFSGITLSRTFFAISYRRKNACFFCQTIIWETFSPALFIVAFYFFNEPCQLFISKEWNHPVTLLCRSPWFYEGKGDGGRLTTTVYDSPTGSNNFQIQIV